MFKKYKLFARIYLITETGSISDNFIGHWTGEHVWRTFFGSIKSTLNKDDLEGDEGLCHRFHCCVQMLSTRILNIYGGAQQNPC